MSTKSDKKISERLLLSRRRAKVSREDIAKALNISVGSVGRYERGERPITTDIINGWADITNCNSNWLLTGEGEAGESQHPEISFLEEDMIDYNKIIQDIEQSGDVETIKEMDHLLAELGRKHRNIREKIKNLQKKDLA